ncbi:anchored repeat ABC transporter, substrate-binding protein [Corynebacterium accolens]|uniref:anchored repeat ABC transporter, substrate-binding protein n=1 Tax=Corynebacterium accolens TaxID=38284 RepID=UPI00254CBE8D|nr:anchored repeat ABC transporter, substrate-binding protein [Corynebacterium accolens]MDK8710704.1 anchored repeat ABC transporter, substrate-binding protein [Corynebacterium accolens]MDK8783991.1 anchored repeat ABC transporter, substrate-binding protein [Corynebacterium accolens]
MRKSTFPFAARSLQAIGAVGCVSVLAAGCTTSAAVDASDRFSVVATTPILADLAEHVAGEDAEVTGLIPSGKDPHTFEPTLRTVRNVANADLSLSNGFLLEPQSLSDTLRESSDAPVVEVADAASTRGATLVPLVEDVSLDAIWLGLRISGAQQRSSGVDFHMVSAEGPGDVAAYVVSTFGTPEVLFDSADGIDEKEDSVTLPANAHTHVSWGFSEPGIYKLGFQADGTEVQHLTVAVGVNPPEGMDAIDSGHLDIEADLAAGAIDLRDQDKRFDPAHTAVSIPSSVLQPIPADPAYRFLGTPGSDTYLLPQAVLGKHIHGEVDPHLWHNVDNAIAYVDVIAEEMAQADPSHGADYRKRAAEYTTQLRKTDDYVNHAISSIPKNNRHLVTTHHGYAYLEQGYDISVAGFVTPNPAIEPSPREVIALRRTLENLNLPAVFVEPVQQASTRTLEEAAQEQGVALCPIYGDTLDSTVPTYIDLMKFNADSLKRCLNPSNGENHA